MDADKLPFDGNAVPRAVEYLVRLAIRWTLYAVGAIFFAASVVSQMAAWPSGIALSCAVAGCAAIISGWFCTPRRKHSPPGGFLI
jgi:hypothetical protein